MLLAACGGARAPSKPSAPTASAPAAAEPATTSVDPSAWLDAGFAITPLPPIPVEVTVLAPGAEPRAPLRYPTPPARRIERRLRFHFDTSFGYVGTPMQQAGTAPWTLPVAMWADAPADPWHYRLGALSYETDAEEDALRYALAGWTPSEGTLAFDARGLPLCDQMPMFSQHPSTSGIDIMRIADDLFAAWMPVYPAEPLGLGARWQVVDRPQIMGVTAARTRTYSIVGGPPHARHLHVETSIGSDTQKTFAWAVGTLLDQEVASWTLHIMADVILDAASPLPQRASASYRSEQSSHTAPGTVAAELQPVQVVMAAELE
jgi:hypothetical protein